MIYWLQWMWLLLTWVLMGGVVALTVNLRRRIDNIQYKRQLELPPSIPTVHNCGGLWGRWEPRKIRLIDSRGNSLGAVSGQERACEGCGFIERRKINS